MPTKTKAKVATIDAYKVVDEYGVSQYGHATWSLPTNGQPGDWMEAHDAGPLEMCSNGIHAYESEQRAKDESMRSSGQGYGQVYLMELEGALTETREGKVCGRRGRLVKHLWDRGEMVVNFADYVWQ